MDSWNGRTGSLSAVCNDGTGIYRGFDTMNSISSGFNVGDVEGVITQIGIEMAHQMAEGKSVKLDGIGTFSPSLALCKDKREREK